MNWLLRYFQPSLEWPETITYGDIERIKLNADVDLCAVYVEQPEEGKHALSVWEDMLRDVGVTVNVLRWWLDWNDKKLQQHAHQLTAAKIAAGVKALEVALDSFFLDLGRGPIFGMACRVARSKVKATAQETERCERQLESLMEKAITEKYGDSLASLTSDTPAPTSSGN